MTAIEKTGRRGRILYPQADGAMEDPGAARLLPILYLCLPLFGQTFHYMIDLPPMYYLSKAWPIISLPLAFYAFSKMRLPMGVVFGLLAAYLLGITPILSMIYLNNGLIDAAATTAKSLPFLYYFSGCGFFLILGVSPRQIRTAFLSLGVATFAMMLILWMIMPDEAYRGGNDDSKLFLFDFERGNRIYMPMFFGMIFMFYLGRRLVMRRDLLAGILLLICFYLLLHIYKQRTAIGAVAGVIGLMAIGQMRGITKVVFLLTITVASLIGIYLAIEVYWPPLQAILGGSLTIRQNSSNLALTFMSEHPLAMLFGAGSITHLSSSTLQTLLHSDAFYLADLGWLGVGFEYGIIGSCLILICYLVTLVYVRRTAKPDDLFAQCLGDHVLYLLLTSAIYSVVFTPGEVATVMATGVVLAKFNDDGAAKSQPPSPSVGIMPAKVRKILRALPRGLKRG